MIMMSVVIFYKRNYVFYSTIYNYYLKETIFKIVIPPVIIVKNLISLLGNRL